MMKLIWCVTALLIWTTPVMAETYSWVDENGTYNFSEDYSRVPKKYRNTVGKRGDFGAAPAPKDSVTTPSTVTKSTSPGSAQDTTATKAGTPTGSFGGKSHDQWKQEFSEREAAMSTIKKRVEEIDIVLKRSSSNKGQTQSLIAERNKAVEQFAELRKQYDALVDQARKAGVLVNM